MLIITFRLCLCLCVRCVIDSVFLKNNFLESFGPRWGAWGFYVTGTMVFRREGNECLNVVWVRLGLRHDITLLLGSLTHLVLSSILLSNFSL